MSTHIIACLLLYRHRQVSLAAFCVSLKSLFVALSHYILQSLSLLSPFTHQGDPNATELLDVALPAFFLLSPLLISGHPLPPAGKKL